MAEASSVSTSANKEYQIYFGENIHAQLSDFLQTYESDKIFVVIDEKVFDHHYSWINDILQEQFSDIHLFSVPSGESSKSVYMFTEMLDFILSKSPERSTPLLAVGGGVTGDLAGFAAATTLRGIPLIHVPTTLLAMVDSSIGGKTGINHTTGKNLIGSFYQPEAVFADVAFLETLSQKEWVNGLSEVLKYAMIHSPNILEDVNALLEKNLFTNGNEWLPIIKKSAQIKVEIVADDVLESGKRKFLNFGHTFAHVLELLGNYSHYSHGEAVFAGMLAAVQLSNNFGASIDETHLLQFKSLYNFTLSEIQKEPTELLKLMMRDKKVHNKQLQLVLLKEMGHPYIHIVDDPKPIENAWNYILKEFEK